MNMKMLKAAVAGLVLSLSSFVNASLITVNSLDTSNNGQRGIMFDVMTGTSAVNLAEISTFFYNATSTYELYFIEGGLSGNESNAGAWTLHDSITGFTGYGEGATATWSFKNLYLNSNTTYGLYFTNTSGGGIHYNDSVTLNELVGGDQNLSVYAGLGRSYAFGNQYNSRALAGSLSYNLTQVPEPSTLAIFALSFMGLAARRLKKK
ncbi:PEP-CTERM sorting domain-containing protein [Colwellia sp. D2M02]|uniref:PEP-CTERM sorting domain-containing protein n=1 Tax=Colwellia sp. D2M02 TaxID=2841562 RepID=UPI001C09C640|nr:PEP-CTERM sorting domain-containing protein [Colwellia sp. D2M02]MBU2892072.1 PEP-CTERM sorting domain-containing protein [Colwellia sp. D2M02]